MQVVQGGNETIYQTFEEVASQQVAEGDEET